MREKEIEQKLVTEVKRCGGICPKLISPSFNGVPDRLVLFPQGKMAFVELKAPNKKMRALQIKRKKQLETLGFKVYCVDRVEMIDETIKEIGGDAK